MIDIKDVMSKAIIEESTKDIIRSFAPSGILALILKLISKISWLDFVIMFFFCVLVISIFVIRNKQQDSEILNSYKILNNSNNFRIAYGEKWLLSILMDNGIKTFLRTEDFASLINADVEYIENHYDPDDEVWSMIYSTQKKFADKDYVDTVINNLIAYGFVEEKNNRGLLKINSSIFNYKKREKLLYEVNKEKEQKQRQKSYEQKEIKRKIAILKAKIKNIFSKNIELSSLEKTWILDVDGTIVKHNGYLIDGHDTLLEGVKDFFDNISVSDTVILLTARKEQQKELLEKFLAENSIYYDYLLTDIPMGERILINDKKPSGLNTSIAINKKRDKKLSINYKINEDL